MVLRCSRRCGGAGYCCCMWSSSQSVVVVVIAATAIVAHVASCRCHCRCHSSGATVIVVGAWKQVLLFFKFGGCCSFRTSTRSHKGVVFSPQVSGVAGHPEPPWIAPLTSTSLWRGADDMSQYGSRASFHRRRRPWWRVATSKTCHWGRTCRAEPRDLEMFFESLLKTKAMPWGIRT